MLKQDCTHEYVSQWPACTLSQVHSCLFNGLKNCLQMLLLHWVLMSA